MSFEGKKVKSIFYAMCIFLREVRQKKKIGLLSRGPREHTPTFSSDGPQGDSTRFKGLHQAVKCYSRLDYKY